MYLSKLTTLRSKNRLSSWSKVGCLNVWLMIWRLSIFFQLNQPFKFVISHCTQKKHAELNLFLSPWNTKRSAIRPSKFVLIKCPSTGENQNS